MTDRQLHAALDTIPGLVWLAGVDGAAEYLNRRWLEYSGLSQTQAIGWGWTAAVHPDDVDQLTDVWRRVLKAGVRGEAEARLRRFDGEYRWFLFTAEPLHDESGAVIGWSGTNIDITEQRQAKAALEAHERELSLIIETMPAFVWSASTDGRLIYVNQRLFDYIGAPMEVLRDEGWVNFVHPDDRREAIDRWLHSVATGAPLENQYRLRRADGVYRWFHVPGQLGRTADGRSTLWYGLLIDIDDRKSVEESLRLTQTKLSRATQIATVGEIAASIAHEINQPLAAIVTNGEAGLRFLNRDVPDLNEARDALLRMISDGRRAGEVVQRIRALFKGGALETTALDLNDVIGEVLELLGSEITRKDVSLETKLETGLPLVVGERVQLQQLIFNLILNGIEAMDSVSDRCRTLFVRSSRSGASILVEIRDTGTGLREPDKIFDAFFTTKKNGLGMGLAVCRSIIEAHQGKLWASSVGDGGSTFYFSLPVADALP
jgi:PAS domain S-box-containing protein